MSRYRSPALRVIAAAALALLVSCSSTPPAPTTYTVKRGDTLYAIAWRHRLDYRDLARWNGIGRDYLIHPGQVLRLTPDRQLARTGPRTTPPPRSTSPPARTAPPSTSSPRGAPSQRSAPAATQASPQSVGPPVRWHWPVAGATATLTSRPNGGHGLMITGRSGQEIHSAADGKVVYTGSGLLGYGQLLIIKHNDTYLSAYGHTQTIGVREGDAVSAGQRVATMGNGPQGTPMLYFEIRVDGVPGNPLLLLPPQ